MMKKILVCLLLVSLLALCFSACRQDKDLKDGETAETTEAAENNEVSETESETESQTRPPIIFGDDDDGDDDDGQNPNDAFDPSTGDDELLNDENWTPNY